MKFSILKQSNLVNAETSENVPFSNRCGMWYYVLTFVELFHTGVFYMDNYTYSIDNMRVSNLFDPGHTLVWEHLMKLDWPWEAIPLIGSYVEALFADLEDAEYEVRPDNVRIHKTANVAATAYLGSNIIIGPGTEVRHCAYIRKDVIVGGGAVIGNSTELKNVILFDGVQVPHYNYVGDSILGYKAHFGAGVITSNVKSDSTLVSVACGEARIETGLKKFGAIVGDRVEVGCNAVLNPATVIGANTNIYPLSMVRGFIPANSIYKKQGEVALKR